MSAPLHVMRWTFDRGMVEGEAVCLAEPGADCRLTSVSCECEHWGSIWRREDGTIWHHIDYEGHTLEPVWHEVKPQDDCNVCLFINEPGYPMELAVHGTQFVIGETPIKPVWMDDGCEWEPVTS